VHGGPSNAITINSAIPGQRRRRHRYQRKAAITRATRNRLAGAGRSQTCRSGERTRRVANVGRVHRLGADEYSDDVAAGLMEN
jgi:hypothetical protein